MMIKMICTAELVGVSYLTTLACKSVIYDMVEPLKFYFAVLSQQFKYCNIKHGYYDTTMLRLRYQIDH